MKKQIISVRIETLFNSDADTSHLGKYSNDAEKMAIVATGEHAGKFVSDLGEDDDLPSRGRNYPYFNPCAENYAGLSAEDVRKYCLQDFARMESFNNGQWHYVGIVAKAVIVSESGVTQTLRSGGLWGIESDSSAEYLKEVTAEQLAELRTELESFGFGRRAIEHAFESAQEVNV